MSALIITFLKKASVAGFIARSADIASGIVSRETASATRLEMLITDS
ncbi:MAG: hypothetical protein VXX88_01075 [Pseudomonadota bacterium]|nr:hypothetical protein [Pseudomonadota bacterium]